MENLPATVPPVDELTAQEIEYTAENGAFRTLDGHQYAAISVLGPDNCGQKSEKYCLNILSTAATVEELDKYIKDIYAHGYRAFDIFIVSMNKFLVLPPPRGIADRKYMQEDLKVFFKNHTDEVLKGQQRVLQRMTGVNVVDPLSATSSSSASSSSNSSSASSSSSAAIPSETKEPEEVPVAATADATADADTIPMETDTLPNNEISTEEFKQ